jgi:hypothetical protein
MKSFVTAVLAAATVLATAPAHAAGQETYLVQDNCYAVGQQVAAQRGATLASAQAVSGGKCKVVLLVPGGNGQRPKREEIIVNQ